MLKISENILSAMKKSYPLTKFKGVLAALLMIAGCAAGADTRNFEPYDIWASNKTPSELAKCIAMESREAVGHVWRVDLEEYSDGSYRILFTDGQAALGDIHIKPGVTTITEFRTLGIVTSEFKQKIGNAIANCSR